MAQLVYRGDGEVRVGEHLLIKDRPVEISDKLAEELKAVAETLKERALELILEPKVSQPIAEPPKAEPKT